MEEDEEINIMDFNSSLVSQNADLLDLEYTVHPQWLLDKSSTDPDFWYSSSSPENSLKIDENSAEKPATVNAENSKHDDSGWTEKEKNLLERGIEIFGKSAVKLGQFIGTKTPSEIRYYMKCFHNKLHPTASNFQLMKDSEIPCTSEQIITEQNKPKKGKVRVKTGKVTKKNTKTKSTKNIMIKGEEIVKIEKTENSDSEIDIEDLEEGATISELNHKSGNTVKTAKKSANLLSHKNFSPPKRYKKKFLNNGEGGCTVSHGDNGEIIETVIIDKEPIIQQKSIKIPRKPPTYLIYSRPYLKEDFRVILNVSALFLMDFHAHSSLSEVMGLLGGFWDESSRSLRIFRYEPCKNSASSTTHCDMCPVSQANSAEKIRSFGMNLIGWFHSHPTFAPEPSQQDLDTQRTFQENVVKINEKCVSVILSPFSRPKILSAPSEFRCMIVEKSGNENNQFVPFKLKVEVECSNFESSDILSDFRKVKRFIEENQSENFTFDKRYSFAVGENLSFIDKFVGSFKSMFEKYFEGEDERCKSLIIEIYDIFKKDR